MKRKDIGCLMKLINDKLKVRADADLKSHGLTLTQSRVLAILNDLGGQATQKELEEILEVAHPTVVGIVSRMEQSGYVTTWADPRRRSKMVCLTPKASALSETLSGQVREQERSMLRGLTPEQIIQLEQMLAMIYKNLE